MFGMVGLAATDDSEKLLKERDDPEEGICYAPLFLRYDSAVNAKDRVLQILKEGFVSTVPSL
ncbi:20014_t:CDS:2 [Gigaspora rosea]|nr:20014_t:CDS:2 [Gigaspora rosea]